MFLLLAVHLFGEKGREMYKTLQLPLETETDSHNRTIWRKTTDELKTAIRNYSKP